MSKRKHWSKDPYWADAYEQFLLLRDKEGKKSFDLDLDAIEEAAFTSDGPAYRLMDAMDSVKELEGMDGFRGAPRVLLALLVRLEEISKAKKR